MSRTLTRTATASASAALLLVLTACGASDGANGSTGGGSDELPKGVLDEMFEEMYGGDNEEALNRMSLQVEERVAACMAEAGFEYVPVDWSQGSFDADAALEVEWGTPEFAEEYGYGATTDPYGDSSPETASTDPNQANNEIVEAMSESEQQAYQEALWGPDTGEEEWTWETGGCQGSAQHEVDLENGVAGDEFDAMEEEMMTMQDSMAADPRITALHAEWASCMADAGHSGFSAPQDAEESIHEQVNAIYDEAYANTDENTTEAEYEAISEQTEARLAEITDEEMATARADYACRDEVDLFRVQAEVNVEYQQKFYDAHKEQLEAWRAAVTQS